VGWFPTVGLGALAVVTVGWTVGCLRLLASDRLRRQRAGGLGLAIVGVAVVSWGVPMGVHALVDLVSGPSTAQVEDAAASVPAGPAPSGPARPAPMTAPPVTVPPSESSPTSRDASDEDRDDDRDRSDGDRRGDEDGDGDDGAQAGR
jgi:hypothetical protein